MPWSIRYVVSSSEPFNLGRGTSADWAAWLKSCVDAPVSVDDAMLRTVAPVPVAAYPPSSAAASEPSEQESSGSDERWTDGGFEGHRIAAAFSVFPLVVGASSRVW